MSTAEPKSPGIGYKLGRLVAQRPLVAAGAIGALVIAYYGIPHLYERQTARSAQAEKERVLKEAAERRAVIAADNEARARQVRADCNTTSAALIEQARAAVKQDDPERAVALLKPCKGVVDTPAAAAALDAALASAEKAVVARKERIDRIWAAEREKAEKADLALRRSQGVRIGMTKDDVLKSSWGRPESINTTTTASGTREQWVYGGRNYLYFVNGVLTTIQN